MKYGSILLIAISLLLINANVSAQKNKLKKADTLYHSGEYLKAAELYAKIYTKAKDKELKANISFKLGDCHRRINDSRNAEKWFRRAVQQKSKNPLAYLYLADAFRMNENYDEALKAYANYKDIIPDDPRGESGIQSCNAAIEWKDKPTRYNVAPILSFNSKESDYAPAYAGDSTDLYFTSARESSKGNAKNSNSGVYFTDIFSVRKDKKGKWSEPVPIEGAINTEFDEGACCLTKDGRTIFYTSCVQINKSPRGCQILTSEKKDNAWGTPSPITIFPEDSTISVGHPSLSDDELTLYFSCNHPKLGMGGKDIWRITRKNRSDDWGKPEILGPAINTKGNELYPFIRQDGVLFFSSDGLSGMGGLDIFKATPDFEGNWTVVNMKYPINSAQDDFGIIFNGIKEEGYLSSTRMGGKGSDDIFLFWITPLQFTIKGVTKNEKNNVVIGGAKVQMTGSDGTLIETNTGVDGSFNFKLKENTDYIFVTFKEKFLKGFGKETTKGLYENKNLEMEIYMKPVDTTDTYEVENIEYDFNKWNLREEAKIELDKLVELLTFNDNITIELGSNTDNRGSESDNQILSQKRAQSAVDYLVSKGIAKERLVAKGYGESKPIKINKKQAARFPFLKEGNILDETFINTLSAEEKEIAHQLNRRTEFRVLKIEYNENGVPFGTDPNETLNNNKDKEKKGNN